MCSCYVWSSGIKPSGQTACPHPDRGNPPGRNYENLELLNRPEAEDNEEVVCMNSKVAQKLAINHLVSSCATKIWYRFYILRQELTL